MTNEQHQEIRQAITKRRVPIAVISLAFVGVVNLFRAWHKHDLEDAIAVSIIFFVVAPLLVMVIYKHDWTS